MGTTHSSSPLKYNSLFAGTTRSSFPTYIVNLYPTVCRLLYFCQIFLHPLTVRIEFIYLTAPLDISV